MWVCVWKGAGDNYIEVVETGGLLIPNAVTLIKAEREGGAANNRGPIQFRTEEKKNLVIYLSGNQSSYSTRNPAKLKKTAFVLGYPLQMH